MIMIKYLPKDQFEDYEDEVDDINCVLMWILGRLNQRHHTEWNYEEDSEDDEGN